MNPKTIFTKTAKGVTQVNQKSASVSRELMKVLKTVDGKSNLDDLERKAEFPLSSLEKFLAQLVKEGYIRVFETRSDPPTGFDDDFDFTAPGKLAAAKKAAASAAAPASAKYDDAAELTAARERAQAEQLGREKAQFDARARAEREAQIRARLDVEAKTKAQAEMRAMEEAKRVQEASERARKDVEAKLAEEKKRKEALSITHARLTQEQLRREEEESKVLVALRIKAEAEAKALAEARAMAEAEAKMLAQARMQAEAAAKRQAEEAARAQQELRDQLKVEIEAKIRQEIEEKLRVEIGENARGELEEAVFAEAKEEARLQLEKRFGEENAALAQLEASARQKAEEDTARMLAEQEVRLRAEMEQRIKAETESLQAASLEAKKRAEKDAQERAVLEQRLKVEAEEAKKRAEKDAQERAVLERQLKVEAEARVRAENEALERKETEARNRLRLDARAREEAEERARADAQMQARLAAEQHAKYEAEARIKHEIEERQRQESESLVKLELERRGRVEAEKKAELESKARAIAVKVASEHAEERNKIAAEAEGKLEVERRARVRAEAKSREQDEAEERDRQEQVERLKRLEEQAERNRQEAAAQAAVEDSKPRKKRKKPRSPTYWLRWSIFIIVLGLAIGLVLIQVIPLGGLSSKIAKGLSAWMHDEVSVSGVRVALFPRPRLKVDGVSVGKLLDARATSGEIDLDLATLFDDRLLIEILDLRGVTITPEALARVGQWGKLEGRPANVRVDRIVLRDLKLEIKNVNLEAFDADLQFDKGALKRAAIKSNDGKWRLNAKPDGENWQLEYEARSMTMPIGPAYTIEDVKAKGTLSMANQEIVVPEFGLDTLSGKVSGTLRADWKNAINVSVETTVKQISLAKLFELYTRDIQINGRMEGAFSIAASAPSVGALLKTPQIQGNFTIKDGSVSNIDLVQAMRSPESAGRGGATKFTELVGLLQVDNGEIRYSKLKMSGGVLLANGDITLLANESLSGRIGAEIRSSVAQDRGAFTLSGSVAKPQLRRGN